jgi:hypothetical protein
MILEKNFPEVGEKNVDFDSNYRHLCRKTAVTLVFKKIAIVWQKMGGIGEKCRK